MLLDAANSDRLREEIVRLQKELEEYRQNSPSSNGVIMHPFNLGIVRSLNEQNQEMDELLQIEYEELNQCI